MYSHENRGGTGAMKWRMAIIAAVLLISNECREDVLIPQSILHSTADEVELSIISPSEGAWLAVDQGVTYSCELPANVDAADVLGYELQFSHTPTPDGSWDAVRFFADTSWDSAAGHRCVHETLYWRVRIVFTDGGSSRWTVGYHVVG